MWRFSCYKSTAQLFTTYLQKISSATIYGTTCYCSCYVGRYRSRVYGTVQYVTACNGCNARRSVSRGTHVARFNLAFGIKLLVLVLGPYLSFEWKVPFLAGCTDFCCQRIVLQYAKTLSRE